MGVKKRERDEETPQYRKPRKRRTKKKLKQKYSYRVEIREYLAHCESEARRLSGELARASSLLAVAEEYERKAEILRKRAAKVRKKHELLTQKPEQVEKQVKDFRVKSTACRKILAMTGDQARLLTSFPPKDAVRFYISLLLKDQETIDIMLEQRLSK